MINVGAFICVSGVNAPTTLLCTTFYGCLGFQISSRKVNQNNFYQFARCLAVVVFGITRNLALSFFKLCLSWHIGWWTRVIGHWLLIFRDISFVRHSSINFDSIRWLNAGSLNDMASKIMLFQFIHTFSGYFCYWSASVAILCII